VSTLEVVLRALVIALLALAVLPTAASAAVLDFKVTPEDGADFGAPNTITGRLLGPTGAPLANRQVVLEVRSYPFEEAFRPLATAMSGEDGRFVFEQPLDRNHLVRVFAPESGDRSSSTRAYVFPRSALTFELVGRNVIRIVQTYRTPTTVKLTAPTYFYVGKAGKQTAPRAAKAETKAIRRKGRVVKGRFRSTARIRIPQAWKGRFRYASCFPYNAGMGNPKLGCPKKRYRF
jgi:hypothetical protein